MNLRHLPITESSISSSSELKCNWCGDVMLFGVRRAIAAAAAAADCSGLSERPGGASNDIVLRN